MALAGYQPERVTVEYKDKPLAQVRGLSLRDISALVNTHLLDLKTLYDKYMGDGRVLSIGNIMASEELILGIVTEAPDIAATIIVRAADESHDPDAIPAVRTMSMPLQVKILIEIFRLTFEDVGGPKAFAALVALALAKAKTDRAAIIR